jgi:hypothetical protein
MLKLLYSNPHPQILAAVRERIVGQLQAIEGQSGLLKNVPYMVIAGFLLELQYNQALFSVLLGSVCSHIAYYRGLSQYFCFRAITETQQAHPDDLQYILILYH